MVVVVYWKINGTLVQIQVENVNLIVYFYVLQKDCDK